MRKGPTNILILSIFKPNSKFSKVTGSNSPDKASIESVLTTMGFFVKEICFMFDYSFLRSIDREYRSAIALLDNNSSQN